MQLAHRDRRAQRRPQRSAFRSGPVAPGDRGRHRRLRRAGAGGCSRHDRRALDAMAARGRRAHHQGADSRQEPPHAGAAAQAHRRARLERARGGRGAANARRQFFPARRRTHARHPRAAADHGCYPLHRCHGRASRPIRRGEGASGAARRRRLPGQRGSRASLHLATARMPHPALGRLRGGRRADHGRGGGRAAHRRDELLWPSPLARLADQSRPLALSDHGHAYRRRHHGRALRPPLHRRRARRHRAGERAGALGRSARRDRRVRSRNLGNGRPRRARAAEPAARDGRRHARQRA